MEGEILSDDVLPPPLARLNFQCRGAGAVNREGEGRGGRGWEREKSPSMSFLLEDSIIAALFSPGD